MVAVGVGENGSTDVVPGVPHGLETLLHGSRSQAQVDQETRAAEFDEGGVTSGTAGKDGKVHGHSVPSSSVKPPWRTFPSNEGGKWLWRLPFSMRLG